MKFWRSILSISFIDGKYGDSNAGKMHACHSDVMESWKNEMQIWRKYQKQWSIEYAHWLRTQGIDTEFSKNVENQLLLVPDFDNVEEIDTNCSDWILKPESVLDGCYFYNKEINQDFHCTAHAKVYHCRPDTMDGKNGKTDPRLVYDQTINYDFKKHGYGYWTGVDGSGEIVVVKDAEEPNNIQEISKKLYEKFDECKTSRTNLYLLTLDTSFHEVISIVKN